nr:MAG TPA: hypothetical protein [Caudoviricetes sp.]
MTSSSVSHSRKKTSPLIKSLSYSLSLVSLSLLALTISTARCLFCNALAKTAPPLLFSTLIIDAQNS